MELSKKPYEISLWDDVLIFEHENGISENTPDNDLGAVTNHYYKEQKNCIIGSDTMSAPIRVMNPKMVSNINGTNTFTFELNSRYYDEDTGEFYNNPYTALLFNEKKIKVRHGAIDDPKVKWYDLVIKNIQEDSEKKIFTYTAKDQYINELSKTGFELVFDEKTENGVGTINDLATAVLRGSDWQVGENVTFLEKKEEPLYELVVSKDINVTEVLDSSKTFKIDSGHRIYIFYNDIEDSVSPMQIVYAGNKTPKINSDNIIIEAQNYLWENKEGMSLENLSISKYRGERYVSKAEVVYDELLDRYVEVYRNKNGGIQHLYTKTDYITSDMVQSSVVNPKALDMLSGWETYKFIGGEFAQISPSPTITPKVQSYIPESGDPKIVTYFETQSRDRMVNSGIYHNSHLFPEGIGYGAQYVFSAIIGQYNDAGKIILDGAKNGEVALSSLPIQVAIARMYFDTDTSNNKSGYKTEPSILRSWSDARAWYDETDLGTRVNIIMTAAHYDGTDDKDYEDIANEDDRVLSRNELISATHKTSITIRFQDLPDTDKIKDDTPRMAITDIQFFPYVTYNSSNNDTSNINPEFNIIRPGDTPKSTTKTTYYSYRPSQYVDATSPDDIKYDWEGESFPPNYTTRSGYNQYEKTRTLKASKTNRFNLLSQLCELFECWIKFEVERDNSSGEIKMVDGVPVKKVSFHDYLDLEQNNYIGFRYGVNLKSISRTIESEAIASKLIVENNSNEFGKDGYCSIERAKHNVTGEKFLYDFGYYIQKGLLDYNQVHQDLYTYAKDYYSLGYFKQLKEKNNTRDVLIQKASGLANAITIGESNVQTYTLAAEEAAKAKQDCISQIFEYTGLNGWSGNIWGDWETSFGSWATDKEVIANMTAAQHKDILSKEYSKVAEAAEENLEATRAEYNLVQEELKGLAEEKAELNNQFYKKYSRFIQEGTWSSEDYVDDDLYYLDAENTLRASRSPKIDYTINILELSQIEGYENFVFNLGEKTFVEDVEFFGWRMDGSGLPYQEEVIISEITDCFDTPDQNKIKVQNYKNQFEDLFQRLEATSQQMEYKSGAYNRAANVVETDGTIKVTTLQNTLNNNSFILTNAKDQTVIWDNTGITTISPSEPANIVRIVSGGIFLSSDGGKTWRTGITGAGMNASYIRGGQIDADSVRIVSGEHPTFRWDALGISAYSLEKKQVGETAEVVGYNPGTFIRIDQYGLYGIKGNEAFDATAPDENGKVGIEKIQKHANFSLTWDGFVIKSTQREGGYISITEDDDFQVFNNNNCVLKIGQLDNTNSRFGLKLMDNEGKITLEQDNGGRLWLRNLLSIGPIDSDGALVGIGILEDRAKYVDINNGKSYYQVFNANNKFIVYENGRVKATDGEFTGNISATSGSIGGFVISNNELYSINQNLILNGKQGTITAKAGEIGGFTISQHTLSSTNQNLILNGTYGTITAKAGYIGGFNIFSQVLTDSYTGENLILNGAEGKITAKAGSIGGFNLNGDVLESWATDDSGNPYLRFDASNRQSRIGGFIISGTHFTSTEGNSTLYMDGANALIRLGSVGSKIELRGSESSIYIGADTFSDETVGQIIINGKEGRIESGKIGSTQGWSITQNEAIFNNITARGSIKASVLEYGEVQTVGGILLVRPSSRITKVLEQAEDYVVTFELESNHGFHEGDLCLITPNLENKVYCTVVGIELGTENGSGKQIQVQFNQPLTFSDFVGMPILSFGQTPEFKYAGYLQDISYIPGKYYYLKNGEYFIDNSEEGHEGRIYYTIVGDGSVGIGINASEDNTIVEGQAISVFELLNKEGHKKFHILLGKIPQTDNFPELANFSGTYGLYADNVLLNGSLVTAPGAFGKSSGLRTKKTSEKITTEIFGEVINDAGEVVNLNGEILLWAGAMDTSAKAIKEAPFYVNENGCLYAKGAHFAGSVMSDAIITASEIHTAKIVGTGGIPALTITDASVGIVFSGKRNNEETIFLKLSEDSLEVDVNNILLGGVVEVQELKTAATKNAISIKENQIGFSDGYILLDSGKMEIKFENTLTSFDKTEIKVPQRIKVGGGIYYYSDKNDEVAYLPAKINEEVVGYDLYVY